MKRNKRRFRYFRYVHPNLVRRLTLGAFILVLCFLLVFSDLFPLNLPTAQQETEDSIKWVDFDVPYKVLEKTMFLDIESYETEIHLKWTELLAYLGAKYGGNFKLYRSKDLDELIARLNQGESIDVITKDMKLYDYYLEAYTAVLGGFLGEYMIQVPIESEPEGTIMWQSKYGLKAFSPIANGYWYNDYDDFGNGRSYGYQRKHFGHDLMISTGTPIISIESGVVEALGWNQYGGWRIGIRSFDKKRYYYYAHLRKDRPYAADLAVGKTVKAGDVIGYSGQSGYSIKENVNNIDTPHLHVGMQLIFDEKLKDSPNQIWIDMYAITKLLSKNKSPVYKKEETGEYYRKYDFSEPNYFLENDTNKKSSEKTMTALMASEAPEGSIPVPIVMYHGLAKGSVNSDFFITVKTFEKDLKYLQDNNYTTILMQDLIDYVDKGTPLPKKPIILTFDDGYYNNYLYAYPLLREYNMKAVMSVIGKSIDKYSMLKEENPIYSYMTWHQINEMLSSELVEVQNHTYNMHSNGSSRKGSLKKASETMESYQQSMWEDVGRLQNRITEITGTTPTTFVYPFGFVSDDSKDILLRELQFRATITCYEKVNYITRDPESLYRLKRFLRPPNESSREFFRIIAPPADTE